MANLFSRLFGGDQPQAQPQAQPQSQPQNVSLPSIGANIAIPAAAPAQQPKRRGPSLIDTLFGVAAGYSPGNTSMMYERAMMGNEKARAELNAVEQAARERQNILGQITDPEERSIAAANLGKWGEAKATGLESYTLARGARRGGPGGQIVADNPMQFQTGDEIVQQGDGGVWGPVYTRSAPSISEVLQRDKLNEEIRSGDLNRNLQDRRITSDIDISERGANVKDRELAMKEEEYRREETQRREAADRQRAQNLTRADTMDNAVSRAKEYVGSAGFWQRYDPRNLQDRENFTNVITPLKSAITFDGLMQMKANSPNGASGLGALSDYEARLLSDAVAALDVNMSEEELRKSFAEIDKYIKKIRETPASSGPVQVRSIQEARRLPSGTRFLDPNGVERIVP